MNVVLHILRIVAAYLLSALVTGYVVHVTLIYAEQGTGTQQDALNGGFGFGLMITFFIIWLAALPAALVVLFGELKAWRMWWYYAVAGSLIGLGLGSIMNVEPWFPWLGVSFGVVSGLIYWAIAGRKAGLADPAQRRVVVGAMGAAAVVALLVNFPMMLGRGF